MYHFETLDYKTNKTIIIEDTDLKNVLNIILKHDNQKFTNNEDSFVIFEDSVGNKLLEIQEKYLKVALGISKIRKSVKLEKIVDNFNKLNFKNVANITFKNLIHDGIVTIWENDSSSDSINNESDDEYLNETDISSESEYSIVESKSNSKSKNVKELENVKKLELENKKLKEQIKILKSFVDTYRQMSLKINKEAESIIKTI